MKFFLQKKLDKTDFHGDYRQKTQRNYKGMLSQH